MAWVANTQQAEAKSIGLNELFMQTGGVISRSGTVVTDYTALGASAFWACLRVLSQTISSLPLNLYQVSPTGQKTLLNDTRTGRTLTRKPNPRQTTSEWVEQMIVHAHLGGNSINKVTKNLRGEVVSIQPTDGARQTTINELPNLDLEYHVTLPNGKSERLSSKDVLHIKGMANLTWRGIDLVNTLKTSLGLTIAAAQQAEAHYANGSRTGGVLETDKTMSPEAVQRLSSAWEERHKGTENGNRVSVLHDGLKYKQVGLDPQKAQLLESRKYAVLEVCSIMGVPPQLVGVIEASTYNNVSELNRQFHSQTLGYWIKRIEDRINLILPANQCVEFDVSAFLKGDPTTTAEVSRILFESSALTVNEMRERNGLAPVEDGDVYAIDTNNTTLGKLSEIGTLEPPENAPTQESDNSQEVAQSEE